MYEENAHNCFGMSGPKMQQFPFRLQSGRRCPSSQTSMYRSRSPHEHCPSGPSCFRGYYQSCVHIQQESGILQLNIRYVQLQNRFGSTAVASRPPFSLLTGFSQPSCPSAEQLTCEYSTCCISPFRTSFHHSGRMSVHLALVRLPE